MSEVAEASCPRSVSEIDRARAQIYQLLGVLMTSAPDEALLQGIAQLESDDTPLGKATKSLTKLASRVPAADVDREYSNLFIGLGRGELLPYASYYLTGFLNERPLANLRTDLMQRGIKSADDVKEPEDHIGTLCEIMAGIITGEFECEGDLASQKAFFDAHLAKWAELFFTDLEKAQSAVFYAPVGTLGRAFMSIEAEGFAFQ